VTRLIGYLEALGPGLLWAATAIGVSHLVQSTRAGADYGFALVWLIVAANLLKYPFFEAGPRYAVATGKSLLEGYVALGRWAVVLYLVVTVGTMFTVLAAVALVTGGLAQALFGPVLSVLGWTIGLMALSALVVVVGRFAVLDGVTKVIVVVLAASTTAAFALAILGRGATGGAAAEVPAGLSLSGPAVAFVVALLGWMPTGIDAAAWHSLWTLERSRQTGHAPSWREARFDFNLGYLGTCVVSLMFLTLGALVLRPSGQPLAESAGGFAAQLVDVYAATLGEWSRPLILVAAFTTMFSTVLAVSDGFPRVLARMRGLLTDRREDEARSYRMSLAALMTGATVVVVFLRDSFTSLIDLATTLSFLTAPVIGYLNLRAVTAAMVPRAMQPPFAWRLLAWLGLLFLAGLGVLYLAWRWTG
jgi:Mn2+/Fe2+ NRAMP family transporter